MVSFYPLLTIKEHMINVNVLYTSFKKRSVINFSHIDKSLKKTTINEITSLYKYYHKKLWLFKKAFKRGCQHPSNKFEILWQVAQNSFSLLLSYFVAQYVLIIVV